MITIYDFRINIVLTCIKQQLSRTYYPESGNRYQASGIKNPGSRI
jgi:hypothetical protein